MTVSSSRGVENFYVYLLPEGTLLFGPIREIAKFSLVENF